MSTFIGFVCFSRILLTRHGRSAYTSRLYSSTASAVYLCYSYIRPVS